MAGGFQLESAPGPEVRIGGETYLYFGGTSYLGLAGHPEVIEAGCAALRSYGVHSGTSRSGFGDSPPVRAVESLAAKFFNTEAAFYFGSGYASNHVLISLLRSEVDVVVVDQSSHFCVLEAAQLARLPVVTFSCGELESLQDRIKTYSRVLLMADAVGPVTGALAPVRDYSSLLSQCESAYLMLDDAHGFGVLGADGRGLFDHLELWRLVNGARPDGNVNLIVGGTLSKALGGYGGIIPGTESFVARARSASHYFDGASAPAAAVAGSTAKALEIVQGQPELRQRLAVNGRRLREGLVRLGWDVGEGITANFCVSLESAAEMEAIHLRLKQASILLPYIRSYSGIPEQGALRFAVFANHTEEQIDRLLNELEALI